MNSSLKARPNVDAIQYLDDLLGASSNQEKADLLNSYLNQARAAQAGALLVS